MIEEKRNQINLELRKALYLIDLIDGDDTVLEKTPMDRASNMNELMAYRHEGFWKCMDTVREKEQLEQLWNSGKAPWKHWEN